MMFCDMKRLKCARATRKDLFQRQAKVEKTTTMRSMRVDSNSTLHQYHQQQQEAAKKLSACQLLAV